MISLGELQRRLDKLPGWGVEGTALVKEYVFDDFASGAEFVRKIGEVAKELDHDPTVLIRREGVHVELTTENERAITEKDFMLAEAIEESLKQ
jgi:4a-hydroxytetrahydrobiopterin dehydratase